MGFHISFRLRRLLHAAVSLALMGIGTYAMAGGQSLELGTQTGIHDGESGIVLDTQTGIHDGQSGVVLQNAPLSHEPMVPAQQLPTLEQTDSGSGQPPIVVSPNIELSGANGPAPAPRPRCGTCHGSRW